METKTTTRRHYPRRTFYQDRAAMVAALERQTRREVTLYLSDWTDYDGPALLDPEKTPCEQYYYITRECGTYLIPAARHDAVAQILGYYLDTNPDTIRAARVLTIGPAGCDACKADPAELLTIAQRHLREEARTA
jgi:hypothetical protein